MASYPYRRGYTMWSEDMRMAVYAVCDAEDVDPQYGAFKHREVHRCPRVVRRKSRCWKDWRKRQWNLKKKPEYWKKVYHRKRRRMAEKMGRARQRASSWIWTYPADYVEYVRELRAELTRTGAMT